MASSWKAIIQVTDKVLADAMMCRGPASRIAFARMVEAVKALRARGYQIGSSHSALRSVHNGWFIKLECFKNGSDKFYILGDDGGGPFISYGKNGRKGVRQDHSSIFDLAKKYKEKLKKGYKLVTRVPPSPCTIGGFSCQQVFTMDSAFGYKSVQNGDVFEVDLSGINAMLSIVRWVRYEEDENGTTTWRGLNELTQYVMQIPAGVTRDEKFVTLNGGDRLPPTGEIQ